MKSICSFSMLQNHSIGKNEIIFAMNRCVFKAKMDLETSIHTILEYSNILSRVLAESGFTIARKKAGTATWTAGEAKAITHSLGSKDITVGIYDASDELVYAEVVATSTTVATITISLAGTYRYAIIG